MEDYQKKMETVLVSTKINWELRQSFIFEIKAHIEETQDPSIIDLFIRNSDLIAGQFRDLRYFINSRSTCVKNISELLEYTSQVYNTDLVGFSNQLLKSEDIAKSLGAANKGTSSNPKLLEIVLEKEYFLFLNLIVFHLTLFMIF